MFPKIGGFPPKSSILIGVFIINHPFWGTPIFGNTQIVGIFCSSSKLTSVFFSPPGNHLFKVIPSTVGLFSRVKTPILGERTICKTDGSLFKQQKRHQGLVDFTFFSGCFHKKGGNPTSLKHPSNIHHHLPQPRESLKIPETDGFPGMVPENQFWDDFQLISSWSLKLMISSWFR